MEFSKSAQAMLEEIPTETFQQLLNRVRNETSPPGTTHISALDAHLFAHARHTSPYSSLNRGDLIEVQGTASSGKTHLIYHLIITCLLPPMVAGRDLGGWGKAAVLLDSDDTFDVRRREGAASGFPVPEILLEETVAQCLKRLHVFRPTSSLQLAATLINLPQYHAKHLPGCEIALLAIDSIGAFYWPDRFTAEQMREDIVLDSNHAPPSGFIHPLHHVLVALEKFRSSHAPVVLLTNWGLTPLADDVQFFRQHLHPFPSPFTGAQARGVAADGPTGPRRAPTAHPTEAGVPPSVERSAQAYPRLTHHITLVPQNVRPLAARLTFEEAREQQAKFRDDVVQRRQVVGLVRTPGSAGGVVGRFTMRIDEGEILMDS